MRSCQDSGRYPVEASFEAELRVVRPDLVAPFRRALPGARAGVLARLWRSLRFEDLPGTARRRLVGPDQRAYDVGAPKDELTVCLDGREHRHPADLLTALGVPGSAALVTELAHSVASLALSRAGSPSGGSRGNGRDLVASEQSVVDGHPYHPCCRSRPGFAVADQLAFAPEHRPPVQLGLAPLAAADCVVVGDWPDRLRDNRGRVLLPMHPLQARMMLPKLGLRADFGALPADPLMALRTLAPVAGGPHVKTALSLQMTSSVRDISGGSVLGSTAWSDLLVEITGRLGRDLVITRNLAAAALVIGGVPSPDLAALLRESPEVHAGPDERVAPLAAIAAGPVPDDPVTWLRTLARLTWRPTLTLLSWGVALEAHGQNLLVVLDDRNLPRRLVYRDLADIRVSPARLAAIGLDIAGPATRIFDDNPLNLRRKLFGSIIGGTFSNLVSAFGGGNRTLEDTLWSAVAAEAAAAATVLGDAEDRRALLEQPLPVKALCRMRLAGTAAGDHWTAVPNPLRR